MSCQQLVAPGTAWNLQAGVHGGGPCPQDEDRVGRERQVNGSGEGAT